MSLSPHTRHRWPEALAIAAAIWLCTAFAHAETFAVIVNKNNPSNHLSASTIASMYRGETLHWQGGDRIKLVNREISAETRQTFYFHVLNAKPDQVFYRQGTPIPVQSVIERSDDAVVRFVGSIEGAIGYVSLSRLKQIDEGLVKVVLTIEKP
ncbi:MAG: substrate-binding domain-containing protein [Nitrospirae bacterium]|nr:substrate-binding domain-containing protein [Nitrospirota bacterium]